MRTLLRTVVSMFAAVLLVLATVSASHAGDDFDLGQDGDDGASVGGSSGSDDSSGGSGSGGSTGPVYTVPRPYKEYAYVPNCSANSAPQTNDEGELEIVGADALCTLATESCGERGVISYRVYTRQMTADGEVEGEGTWESAGTTCRGSDDPPEGGPPVITAEMIVDAARAVAPTPSVNVQPGTRSYVNVPTNVYASEAAETETVEVLAVSIPVRFEPTSFRWSFGDGGSATGAGVKDAAVGAADSVEHVYRRSGSYDITLARSYAVTATLPNGETLELPTELSNSSDPYPLTIGEIQSVVTGVD